MLILGDGLALARIRTFLHDDWAPAGVHGDLDNRLKND
jgi:hypothetical protein